MDDELEDELDELAGFELDEDELDDELADDDELDDELVEDDELSEVLDFSEVLDELTELLVDTVDDEELESSPHAVKVSTTAAAVTALKIFWLIFIAFFLSINKKVRSRSHAPKNAKLRLLRHNYSFPKRYTKNEHALLPIVKLYILLGKLFSCVAV